MFKRPRILVTNDDGVDAPGIRCLWEALSPWADVTVVAPTHNQSASSLSLTLRSPLSVMRHDLAEHPVWSVNGTPADCVKLALSELMNELPDLVVAGINKGSNAGRNVLYSGTVGGVIEACLRGLPGIAFSSICYRDPNYHLAKPFLASITRYALAHPLAEGTLLNVNFPSCEKSGIKGVKLARQGQKYWMEDPEKRETPCGNAYYWMGGRETAHDEHADSDIHYLHQGYASAVPIHVNELTDHQELEKRRQHFESFLDANAESKP